MERTKVEGISFGDPPRPSVDAVDLGALRVTLGGETVGVDERPFSFDLVLDD